ALDGPAAPPHWHDLLVLNLCPLAGLVLALSVAGLLKLREGYRVRGRFVPFVLFLLLESPTLVYAGILGGTVVGTCLIPGADVAHLLVPVVGGGALLGVLFGLLRQVQHRWARLGLILLVACGVGAGVLVWFGVLPALDLIPTYPLANPAGFAWQLLLGIPYFYLLTFAGQEEESEVEIGAMGAMLGVALGIFTADHLQFRTVGFIVP